MMIFMKAVCVVAALWLLLLTASVVVQLAAHLKDEAWQRIRIQHEQLRQRELALIGAQPGRGFGCTQAGK